MAQAAAAGFGDLLGVRIQSEHRALSERWLERLLARLPLAPNDIFPTDTLLDHIPALLREIGAYLRAPEQEEIAANASVIAKAQELGMLRHEQRASVHQLLREYDILGGILETFVAEETARLLLTPSPAECIEVTSRLNRAVRILMQTTVDTFVSQYMDTINRQTEQLDDFSRMIGHELRNPLITLQFSVAILKATGAEGPDRSRALEVIERNIAQMTQIVSRIEQLSKARLADSPALQEVQVTTLAAEAARQLRDMAEARGVQIRIAADLPVLFVDVARLELVLMNLLSNAIKYSDPAKPERFVRIEVVNDGSPETVVLGVRDNGIGIPPEARASVFDRFFRAHAERDEEFATDGAGLGLSIVQECVVALGGSIRVDSAAGGGTAFFVTLPRRAPAAAEAVNGRPSLTERS